MADIKRATSILDTKERGYVKFGDPYTNVTETLGCIQI